MREDLVTVAPTFFDSFRCKADLCTHTCCQAWEIDIDEETEKKYRAEPGPLGDLLRDSMKKSDDGSTCFKLNEQGFCPLLTKNGLCRLVLEKGDDFLCQICNDHPRFYKYLGNLELCGTGLACERTVEQLMEEKKLLLTEGVHIFTLEDFLDLLSVRKKGSQSFIYRPNQELTYFRSVLSRLKKTEPIDADWTETLSVLERKLSAYLPEISYPEGKDFWNALYQYILYRELDLLTVYPLSVLLQFAQESTDFILWDALRSGNTIRSVCHWSEQIEYSTENVDILMRLIEEET